MTINNWQELYDAADGGKLDPLEEMAVVLINSFLTGSRSERWAWIERHQSVAADNAMLAKSGSKPSGNGKSKSAAPKSAAPAPRHDRNSGPPWTREPATEPQRRKLYAVSKSLQVEQTDLASDALGKTIDSKDIERLTKGEMNEIFQYAEEQEGAQ